MSTNNACSHCGKTLRSGSRPRTAASCELEDGEIDEHYTPPDCAFCDATGSDVASDIQTMYSRPGSVVLPGPQQATQNHGIRSHIKQAAKGAARALKPRSLLQGRRGSQARLAVPTIPASAYCNLLYLNSNATSSSMSIDSMPPTCNQATALTSNPQQPTSYQQPLANPIYQNYAAASSRASIRSSRSGLVLPGESVKRRTDFMPGHIIWAPHHVTAQDPALTAVKETNCVQSAVARICSKRRPMVVLWCYLDALFCLPCATNQDNGFNTSVPEADRHNIYLHDPRGPAPPRGKSAYEELKVERTDNFTSNVNFSLSRPCAVDIK